MRSHFISFFVMWTISFGLGVSTIAANTGNGPSLPAFSEVLSAALSQSLEAKTAHLARLQSAIDRSFVTYDSLPSLTASGTWLRQSPEGAEPRDQSYRLALNYNVFDFGRTSAKHRKAELDELSHQYSLEEVNENLSWQVAKLYLNLLSASRLFAIAQENLSVSENKLTSTRKNYQQGLRPEVDLVIAEGDFNEAVLAAGRSASDLQILKQQLRQVTGKDLREQPLDNANMLQMPRLQAWQTRLSSMNIAPSASQKRRQTEVESMQADTTAIHASTLPTLDLQLSAQEMGSWDETKRVYAGQLQLTWDIPWNLRFREEKRKLSLQRDTLQTEDELESKTRSDAFHIASSRLEFHKQQALTLEKQLKLRARQYHLVKQRFDSGKASNLELSNAELELGNTKLEKEKIMSSIFADILEMAEAKRYSPVASLFAAEVR